MKKISYILLLPIYLLLGSCEFNQSVSTDLTTGANSRGDGLSCDDVFIEVNGQKEQKNEFSYGDEIVFRFKNIHGLQKENGLTFPGLSMFIIENNGDTLVQEKDLLSSLNNGTNLDPLDLEANFVAVMPHFNNEKYKVIIKISDKKAKGVFTYEFPFEIIPNELLKFNASGISFDNIYLWDKARKQTVNKEDKLNRGDEYLLLFNGVKGLDTIDGKVYPTLSLEIIDAKETILLSSENLFADFKEKGINSANLGNQIPVTLTFDNGVIVNPVSLKAEILDAKSDKSLTVTGELNLK